MGWMTNWHNMTFVQKITGGGWLVMALLWLLVGRIVVPAAIVTTVVLIVMWVKSWS